MSYYRFSIFYFVATTACLTPPCWGVTLKPGTAGHFSYVDRGPEEPRNITVWYYCPKNLSPESEIVFVMHGTKRNGADYRDNWVELASTHGFLILVPEFSKDNYPQTLHYQFGNVQKEDGALQPQSEWSLTTIDRIFDHVVAQEKLVADNYVIFGHSAGAQFVHRMILMYPESRARLAIAANAGSYTMPTLNTSYPYGLKESPCSDASLEMSLRKRMVVLLGQEDTDPKHKFLPRAPEAMLQGAHRFERGFAFFDAAQQSAAEHGIQLNWQLVTVPKVGHENAKMAVAAAELIRYAR